MHEMSIALEACRMAEERLAPLPPRMLVEMGLEVGDDAGVEITSLEFCLEAVLAAPPFARARSVIQRAAGDVLRLAYLEIDDGSTD